MSTNSSPSAAIYGCGGLTLTENERDFFRRVNPVGFILFRRNISHPEQVKELVEALKSTVTHGMPLVLIDQEGGRVARLGEPHWRKAPSAESVTQATDPSRAMYLHYRLIAEELADLGINVDCAPMLDVPALDSDAIIGDRALGATPEVIIALGLQACAGLLEGGVLPVIKHIPGHGRATADSHKILPVVSASKQSLESVDFKPFIALRHMPLAMTAHITYSALDNQHCATLSPTVIKIIREEIGFNGLLMTDDLSMHALSGSFEDRTRLSLAAGCDVVLHCNGDLAEMSAIASVCPRLAPVACQRLERAWAALQPPSRFDVAEGLKEFNHLMPQLV